MLFQFFLAGALFLFSDIQAAPHPSLHGGAHKNPSVSTIYNPADLGKILEVMGKLDNSLASFNKSITTFSGKPTYRVVPRLIALKHKSMKIKKYLKRGISAVKKSHSLSEEESNKLATAIVKSVPHTQSVLNNLLAHVHEFDTAILGNGSISSFVAKDLQRQAVTANTLTALLLSRMTEQYQKFGGDVSIQLDQQYNHVIQVFREDRGYFDLRTKRGFGQFMALKFKNFGVAISHAFKRFYSASYRRQARKNKKDQKVDEEVKRILEQKQLTVLANGTVAEISHHTKVVPNSNDTASEQDVEESIVALDSVRTLMAMEDEDED